MYMQCTHTLYKYMCLHVHAQCHAQMYDTIRTKVHVHVLPPHTSLNVSIWQRDSDDVWFHTSHRSQFTLVLCCSSTCTCTCVHKLWYMYNMYIIVRVRLVYKYTQTLTQAAGFPFHTSKCNNTLYNLDRNIYTHTHHMYTVYMYVQIHVKVQVG